MLSGERRLLVEGAERLLQPWDFFHCPAGTEHIFVGAGDGPCVVPDGRRAIARTSSCGTRCRSSQRATARAPSRRPATRTRRTSGSRRRDGGGPPPGTASPGPRAALRRCALALQVDEPVERVRVRERVAARDALGRAAPIRIRLTGTSSSLPESVRGTSRIASTSFGHVPRRAVLAHARARSRATSSSSSVAPSREHDEQRHPAVRRPRAARRRRGVGDLVGSASTAR